MTSATNAGYNRRKAAQSDLCVDVRRRKRRSPLLRGAACAAWARRFKAVVGEKGCAGRVGPRASPAP